MSQTALRVAILGMGNELNGDDAAGVLVARALIKNMSREKSRRDFSLDHLYIADVGPSPEAFTGPLRRFRPDMVILVDAAELGEQPGTVRWLEWQSAEGMSASTHTLPPTVLSRFLVEQLNCRVMLLGIQPECLDFDAGVSAPVRAAITTVTRDLLRRSRKGAWDNLAE